MSLSDRARGWAGIASAGLGVTRWGRVLVAMGVVAVLSLSAGFWAGHRWERGAQAIADSKQSRNEIAALRQQVLGLVQAANTIKQSGLDTAQDYRTAATRLESIADDYQTDRERQRAFAAQQQRDLAQLLRDRPDLDAVDVGRGLLDHWNRSNAGRHDGAATKPAAADPKRPAAPVRSAPARGQQPAARPARQSRRSGGDCERLLDAAQRPGGCGTGAAAHRVAVVLPGHRGAALQGGRL